MVPKIKLKINEKIIIGLDFLNIFFIPFFDDLSDGKTSLEFSFEYENCYVASLLLRIVSSLISWNSLSSRFDKLSWVVKTMI